MNNKTPHQGIPTKRTTLYEEMEAYDALPLDIRKLLAYAPIRLAASAIKNPAAFKHQYQIGIYEHFPNWKPFPTDPL